MKRQHAQMALELPRGRSVEEVRQTLAGLQSWRTPNRLIVRGRSENRVVIRLASGQHHANPTLVGDATLHGDRLRVTGVIRESRLELVYARFFFGLGLLMAAVTVLVTWNFDPAGIVVCGLGSIAFLVIGRMLARQRPSSFALDVEELPREVDRLSRLADQPRSRA